MDITLVPESPRNTASASMKIGLEDPSDQITRKRHPVGVLEELAQGIDEGRAHRLRGAHPVEDKGRPLGSSRVSARSCA